MIDPSVGAVTREDAQRTLAKVLAHRVWIDLRRGWRYTNPSLFALELLDVEFSGLKETVAAGCERLKAFLPQLWNLEDEEREERLKKILYKILHAMVEGLAVNTEALDWTVLDGVAQKSRSLLRPPWAIDDQEHHGDRGRSSLVLRALGKGMTGLREEATLLRAGHNSRIARSINRQSVIGTQLKKEKYLEFFDELIKVLAKEGLIVSDDSVKWRLAPSAIRLVPGKALTGEVEPGNRYFCDLYDSIAKGLEVGESMYWQLEGREHTAQVSFKHREWREWRFRFEDDDRESLRKGGAEDQTEMRPLGESDKLLPVLFCSPTMELGVDISALNTVYLRNVPPTPANYIQRAGRAGRSGQAAAVVTYCASGSPHDQYFFARREDMVAGVVRPPQLDITNEELVRSHLHAVWLAETKQPLSPDIPNILNLENEEDKYPLKEEIKTAICKRELVKSAPPRIKRVLDQILEAAAGGAVPPWMGETEEFVRRLVEEAPENFDRAFDRWRELYQSASDQLKDANTRSEAPGLSRKGRNKIKAIQGQAGDQIQILEQGKASNGSDFYSYRYLATEGFLPGYNFPRLPLYAFIPGEGKRGSFISRARFLAISEFGPRSLIYHEGRSYRVIKAKLPPDVRMSDGSELATKDIYICPDCGACHEEEVERCHGCDTPMAGKLPVKRTLRIDNVEAAPTERITANDEERVRQGFDIQTVFSWPKKDGQAQVANAEFKSGGTSLMLLQYANSTEISRLNRGLKRRKNQTVFGFNINPQTGRWAKSEDEDDETDKSPEAVKPVRIVPIVRDRKNALLFRFMKPENFKPETITTVQHALLRGIEVVYQLEEGEILGEPLPSRDGRRAILAYEATEGGAGVLTRLINEPEAIGRVARTALELMHFKEVEAAVSTGNASLLKEEKNSCVRGCYRCLLSYFNQPDHEHIDRSSSEVVRLLLDLARGKTVLGQQTTKDAAESPWVKVFADADLPPAAAASVKFAGVDVEFAWRSYLVAATTNPVSPGMSAEASGKGWELIEIPAAPDGSIPEQLVKLLKGKP